MRDTRPPRPHARRLRGFTLIELMVSIVLVLILILGINQVFKIASDSVGAGQAVSDQGRDNRAVQTVLFNDLAQSVIRSSDAPFFIIRSSVTAAFLDRADELTDNDYPAVATSTQLPVDTAIRTVELNDNNVEGEAAAGEILHRLNLSRRNHRQDIMCFFARHLYPRQTGNDGTYAANMTGSDAFVWYGHVRQPVDALNVSTVNENPGYKETGGATTTFQTNPNNFYARQWGLGRAAILLREPEAGFIYDKTVPVANPQRYFARLGVIDHDNYSPLGFDSVTSGTVPPGADPLPPSAANTRIQSSRYDLAGTSIDGFRNILELNTFPMFPWPAGDPRWYGGGGLAYRLTGYPFPIKPLSSYGTARTVPWLVGGCTQFIVEFAGDFLNQDPVTGAFVNTYATAATDGQTDFVVLPTLPAPTRATRWYGFPRDVNGATAATVGRPDGTVTLGFASPDVLPLRDSLGPAGQANVAAPCEHFVGSTMVTNYNAANQPALNAEYIVAWQPPGTYINEVTGAAEGDVPKPTMIRVTMTIDDPRGRLPGGSVFEYVIELP